MAQKLRIQYPVTSYHVMNRGDHREPCIDRLLGEWDKLALQLRAETNGTVAWIAERHSTGTRGYLNHLPHKKSLAPDQAAGPVQTALNLFGP